MQSSGREDYPVVKDVAIMLHTAICKGVPGLIVHTIYKLLKDRL